jgi:hypothetical protein
LECRDDPVELAVEEWRNTPQPDHDLAAPHDVGAPSPDSPRLKEKRLPTAVPEALRREASYAETRQWWDLRQKA